MLSARLPSVVWQASRIAGLLVASPAGPPARTRLSTKPDYNQALPISLNVTTATTPSETAAPPPAPPARSPPPPAPSPSPPSPSPSPPSPASSLLPQVPSSSRVIPSYSMTDEQLAMYPRTGPTFIPRAPAKGLAFITPANEIFTQENATWSSRLFKVAHSVVDVDTLLGIRIPASRVLSKSGRGIWIRSVVDFTIPSDSLPAFVKCSSPLAHLQSLAASIQRTVANHFDDDVLLQESNEQLTSSVFEQLEPMAKEFGVAVRDFRLLDLFAEPSEPEEQQSEFAVRAQIAEEQIKLEMVEVEAIRQMLQQPNGRQALQLNLLRRYIKALAESDKLASLPPQLLSSAFDVESKDSSRLNQSEK